MPCFKSFTQNRPIEVEDVTLDRIPICYIGNYFIRNVLDYDIACGHFLSDILDTNLLKKKKR